ncbi:hypothetical protein AB6A23_07035 [Paenibacillus tarimensis]
MGNLDGMGAEPADTLLFGQAADELGKKPAQSPTLRAAVESLSMAGIAIVVLSAAVMLKDELSRTP